MLPRKFHVLNNKCDNMENEKDKAVEMTDEEFEEKLENLEKKLTKLKKEVKSLVDFVDKKNYLGGGYLIEIVALLERSIFKIYNFRTEMDYWTMREEAIEVTEDLNKFTKGLLDQMKEDVGIGEHGKN